MNRQRLCLAVAFVGLLCLPAPLYLPAVADATHDFRTASSFHGNQVDDPTTQEARNYRAYWTNQRTLSTDAHSLRHGGSEFRAPNETRRTLETALRNGSATTDDPEAMADLRGIDRNYSYVSEDANGTASYAAFTVAANGSRIETTDATEDDVFEDAVDQFALEYETLEPETQRAVDRIIENTSDGYGRYHPREDNPVVDREPMLVQVDGEVYDVRRDDATVIGPRFPYALAGYVAGAFGFVLFAGGGILFFVLRKRAGDS